MQIQTQLVCVGKVPRSNMILSSSPFTRLALEFLEIPFEGGAKLLLSAHIRTHKTTPSSLYAPAAHPPFSQVEYQLDRETYHQEVMQFAPPPS